MSDLGFRPQSNGFNFSNYGGEEPVTNLTPVEIRRMFGDKVCARLEGEECTLTPPAQQWMEQANTDMPAIIVGVERPKADSSWIMAVGKARARA